jgi:hypothetical protein
MYQIVVSSREFTRWHNAYYGTDYPDDKAVPTDEFDRALSDNELEFIESLGDGTWNAKYVLRPRDGGVTARRTGLDRQN